MKRTWATDTIAAIATAVGPGGVGIVRVSGPDAIAVADRVFRSHAGVKVAEMKGYQAAFGDLVDTSRNDELVDECLCLVMRAPHSYTGEDVVELQCHGGTYLLHRALQAVLDAGAPDIRLAERGEFTRRAFLNGRLDLTQAEAVLDLIQADSEAAHKNALRQLKGALQRPLTLVTSRLLEWVAQVEALIDFPEDEVEGYEQSALLADIERLSLELKAMADSYRQGKIIRDGLPTALLGRPNVGKSSLFNYLVGQDRAIVTEMPGTTRDVIEERVRWGELVLVLSDTAGIRRADDVVERIGVEKSKQIAEEVRVQMVLFDVTTAPEPDDQILLDVVDPERAVILLNKADLGGDAEQWRTWLTEQGIAEEQIFLVSALRGTGLDQVRAWLEQKFLTGDPTSSSPGRLSAEQTVVITNERHRQAMLNAVQYLEEAKSLLVAGQVEELLAVELRAAWAEVAMITGELVEDDILTHIFSRFCIGK